MNKRIIYTLLLGFMGTAGSWAQNDMSAVLKTIEQNNLSLQAEKQRNEAQYLMNKTDNNLPDPEVSYSYQNGKPGDLGHQTELTVTQGFDFPTLYGSRSKLNRLQLEALNQNYRVARREVLGQAQQLCLQLVALNKKAEVLEWRKKQADELQKLYEIRMQKGDANQLEMNKIRLELMGVEADLNRNVAEHRTVLQELIALNGGLNLDTDGLTYPEVAPLSSLEQVQSEVLSGDPTVAQAGALREAAQSELSVSKSGWLPSLSVGFRRNTGVGQEFNGIIVGGSIPLWSNRNKVKSAKARLAESETTLQQVQVSQENNCQAFYNKAVQLQTALQKYDVSLMDESLALYRKALDLGQLSIIDYFRESESVYADKEAYLNLEAEYHQTLAYLYRNRL